MKPRHFKIELTSFAEAQSLDPGLLATGGLVVAKAEGCWLFDTQDRRYFDASAGSGAVNLGHQHPRVIEAIVEQASRLLHSGWNLQSDIRTEAVQRLGAFSPFRSCSVLFTVTGAEGIEAAIKTVLAYTGRQVVVAFEHSFHGKTAGALAVTWREGFKRFTFGGNSVIFAPYPLLHRPEPQVRTEACLETLDRLIAQLENQGQLPAAFIIEPVQGAEGILPAGSTFLEGVLERARRIESLVIYDEVYTGFGRCGSRFYGSRQGLTPDLMVVGKALGNGLPISALIGPREVLDSLPSGHHTSTFSGHPLSCAAACAVLETMTSEQSPTPDAQIGLKIRNGLHELSRSFPFISQPRGEGLMLAFDCIDQRGEPRAALAHAYATEALRQGVVLRHGGFEGSAIKLTPPLLMTSIEIEFLLGALRRTAEGLAERKDADAVQ